VDLSTLADCYLSHPVRTGCSGINKQRSHGLEMYKYHIIFSVSDGSLRSKFKFAFAAYKNSGLLKKKKSKFLLMCKNILLFASDNCIVIYVLKGGIMQITKSCFIILFQNYVN